MQSQIFDQDVFQPKDRFGTRRNISNTSFDNIHPAIISVYDKTGLLDLAKGLIKHNVRLLASGGTAKMIRESGFAVEYASGTPAMISIFPIQARTIGIILLRLGPFESETYLQSLTLRKCWQAELKHSIQLFMLVS